MELSTAIQEALVAILCFDPSGADALVVRNLVPAEVYDPYYRDIAERAVRYLDKYKKPPGEHTTDIVEALRHKEPKRAEIYKQIFDSLIITKNDINRQYIIHEATTFCRYQRLKSVMDKASDILDNAKEAGPAVEEAEAELGRVTKPIDGMDLFDHGLFLNDPVEALAFMDSNEDDVWKTGIEQLDNNKIGPARGRNYLYMGPGNSGKTWWAVNLGKFGLLSRAKVLHVSLEMNKDMIAMRYVQSFFSMSKRKIEKLVVHRLKRDKLDRFVRWKPSTLQDIRHLSERAAHRHLTEQIKKVLGHKPRLVVKHFPTGRLTVKGLEAYLTNLEQVKNFIPDIVIVDYPDLMQIDEKNARMSISRIHVDLRGLSQERNFALCTLTQSNRASYGAKKLNQKHVSESIEKYNTADVVVAYNQTDMEEELGLARLHVMKSREEKRNDVILISQAYAIGQYCLDSTLMSNRRYWSLFDKSDDEN